MSGAPPQNHQHGSRSYSDHSVQSVYPSPGDTEPRLPSWPAFARDTKAPSLPLPQEPSVRVSIPSAKMTVDDTIASADLQNPSDALEFLAHVADRAEGNQLPPLQSSRAFGHLSTSTPGHEKHGKTGSGGVIDFAPLNRGQLHLDVMHELLRR